MCLDGLQTRIHVDGSTRPTVNGHSLGVDHPHLAEGPVAAQGLREAYIIRINAD